MTVSQTAGPQTNGPPPTQPADTEPPKSVDPNTDRPHTTVPDTETPPAAAVTTPIRWRLLLPGALYVAVRALGVLILLWFSKINDKPFTLHGWDGAWYLAIARSGYTGVPSTMLDLHGQHGPTTSMVFFPGYPQLVRWTAFLFQDNYVAAAITISTIAGIAASYGVARLTHRHTHSARATIVMVALFAAAPMSIVYSMAYPEALLCACTAWALVGLTERRWWLAGICTAAAGYVSPMAAPLIVAVGLVALIDLVKGRAGWSAVATILMAPAGMLGYLMWVAAMTGNGSGYFLVQKQGWGTGFDFGWSTMRWFERVWSGDRAAFTVLTTWIVLAAVVLLVLGAGRHAMPWQLWLFSCLTLVLIVGATGIQWDKVRLLLVAFPLLLPIAATIARQRTSTAIPLVLGFVFAGLWFGAYGLTVWQFSI
ncbi:MAG TPA: hypothetical protein VH352_07615 [Pseudonocardiaceae bacterium]|nr:hypothetical protein [Pseudonocardiaceae bacterium]